MLELVGLGSDQSSAAAAAAASGGVVYINHPEESDKRPYSTLIRASTYEIEAIQAASDIALYVCYARTIKPLPDPPSPDRVIGTFPLVAHPDMGHRRADDHWRDTHAPLALLSHSAMCDYTQLSIVATLSGRELDGIALCAFESRDDLRTKFFNDDDARAAIEVDVNKFADVRHSPRRVVMTQL